MELAYNSYGGTDHPPNSPSGWGVATKLKGLQVVVRELFIYTLIGCLLCQWSR